MLIMDITPTDIYFSKHEISIYENLFSTLDSEKRGFIETHDVNQLQALLQLDSNQINSHLQAFKVAANFDQNDFNIFIRLAAIWNSHNAIKKELICKFDTPTSFIDLLIDSVQKIMSLNRARKDVVLPPPPTKTKLKRVHTMPGSCTVSNVISTTNQTILSSSTSLTTPSCYDSNPESAPSNGNGVDVEDEEFLHIWSINNEQRLYYIKQFLSLQGDLRATVQGSVAKVYFEKSSLPLGELSLIWKLSDMDKDGALSLPEFCIAMHLVVLRRNGVPVPVEVPQPLLQIFRSLNADGLHRSSQFGSHFQTCKLHMDELTEEMRRHSIRSADQISSSQAWTRFNDSPAPSLSSSPTKMANFEYIVDQVAKNPNIKHPVAVRLSPSSPPIAFSEPVSSKHSSRNSYQSLINEDSSLFFDSVSACKLISRNEDSPYSSSIASFGNRSGTDSEIESISNAKDFDEYLTSVENRLMYHLKAFGEVPVAEESSAEDMEKTISTLTEYSSDLCKKNREMFVELATLVKVCKKMNESRLCNKCKSSMPHE